MSVSVSLNSAWNGMRCEGGSKLGRGTRMRQIFSAKPIYKTRWAKMAICHQPKSWVRFFNASWRNCEHRPAGRFSTFGAVTLYEWGVFLRPHCSCRTSNALELSKTQKCQSSGRSTVLCYRWDHKSSSTYGSANLVVKDLEDLLQSFVSEFRHLPVKSDDDLLFPHRDNSVPPIGTRAGYRRSVRKLRNAEDEPNRAEGSCVDRSLWQAWRWGAQETCYSYDTSIGHTVQKHILPRTEGRKRQGPSSEWGRSCTGRPSIAARCQARPVCFRERRLTARNWLLSRQRWGVWSVVAMLWRITGWWCLCRNTFLLEVSFSQNFLTNTNQDQSWKFLDVQFLSKLDWG